MHVRHRTRIDVVPLASPTPSRRPAMPPSRQSTGQKCATVVLAHELAHLLLHEDLIDAAPVYDNIDGWILFLQSFDPDDLRWIENQAYGLAGLLLVPADKLEEEYLAVAKQLEDVGRDFDSLTPPTMKLITSMIGEKFQVSRFVINKRARKEDLWNWDEDLIE